MTEVSAIEKVTNFFCDESAFEYCRKLAIIVEVVALLAIVAGGLALGEVTPFGEINSGAAVGMIVGGAIGAILAGLFLCYCRKKPVDPPVNPKWHLKPRDKTQPYVPTEMTYQDADEMVLKGGEFFIYKDKADGSLVFKRYGDRTQMVLGPLSYQEETDPNRRGFYTLITVTPKS